MKAISRYLSLLVFLACPALTMAESAPVQFSTITNFNAPANDSVVGVRFPALYGKTSSVKGADLHLLAIGETDEFVGIQFPLLFAGANHVNKSMTGAAFGLWNYNKGQTTGLNWAAVNITTDVTGANIGFVNLNKSSTTFDLGIFNKTENLKGVQIGLINCAKNGFLPCFPIFNFGK